MVDVIDFYGSFLKKVRDVVGGNSIFFVVIKVDLLDLKMDFDVFVEWVGCEVEM